MGDARGPAADGAAEGAGDARVNQKPPPRTTVTGTLIQKIARQDATATIAAPYSGPATLPSSWRAPTRPRGKPRASGGQRAATMAWVTGTSPPPPTPWRARPATTTGRAWAVAVTTEPIPKALRHPANTGSVPARSAKRPIRGRTAVYPRRKPLMIGVARCRRSSPTPTPVMIDGRATTTT